MKKRIFALLTAICCLALTSCGNNETDSETARAVEPKSRMTEYYAMLAVPDNGFRWPTERDLRRKYRQHHLQFRT